MKVSRKLSQNVIFDSSFMKKKKLLTLKLSQKVSLFFFRFQSESLFGSWVKKDESHFEEDEPILEGESQKMSSILKVSEKRWVDFERWVNFQLKVQTVEVKIHEPVLSCRDL